MLVRPYRIAETDFAWIGYSAPNGAAQPADDCTRSGISRKGTDRCTSAGTNQAARCCAITRCGATRHHYYRNCCKKHDVSHFVPHVL
jgi:hypothetical protein